ncbi:MAG: hypothetical protein H7844_06535 [Nitrospirae bacterium YQR-1]
MRNVNVTGRGFLINTLIVFFSLFLALTLGEIFLRVTENTFPVLKKAQVVGWRGVCAKEEQNQLGFRGRSVSYSDNDFVVLLVGDSQVHAGHYPFNCMPEAVLEHYLNGEPAPAEALLQQLNDSKALPASCGKLYGGRDKHRIKVFSIGTDGYGQDQELLALSEYFKTYRAGMSVLWFTPTNDIWNNVFPTHFPGNKDGTPKPTFILRKDKLIYPPEAVKTARPLFRLTELYNMVFFRYMDGKWEKYLPKPYEPLTSYNGPETPIKYDFPETENFKTEKTHFSIILTPRSERMTYGIRLTNRLIREIESLSAKNGSRFVAFWNDVNWSTRKNAFWYHFSHDTSEHVFKVNGGFFKGSRQQYDQNISDVFSDIKHYRIEIREKNWFKSNQDAHMSIKALDESMHTLADNVLKDIPEKYLNR